MQTIPCTTCRSSLPEDSFHRAGQTRRDVPGDIRRQYRCKDCVREYNAQPEQRRAAYGRHLTRTYGLTIAQYEELEAAQNGCCAICALPPQDSRRLVVDHDHDTGALRGLLCVGCNAALGAFATKERLTSALSYLHQYTT